MAKQKRKWSEAIDRGIEAYRSGEYVYLYGAKNVRLTSEAQIRQYFAAEKAYFSSRYSADELDQIVRNSIGHMAVDCSGLTGWVCTGDKQYSIGQINNCSKYSTLYGGKSGSIVFTTFGGQGRHIGIDVSCGLILHAGYESTDKNIREGRAGILLEPISARAWERSGESNVIDYAGSYSPYPPTAQLWAELHPSPKPVPFDGWIGEAYGKQIIPVYANPTGSSPLIAWSALGAGNLFEVTGDAGNRWQIKIANQHIGYLDKQYCLRKTPQRTGIVGTDLWLRQGCGANTKGILIMPRGASVQICDTKTAPDGRPWDYVLCAGQWGFCSDRYIK